MDLKEFLDPIVALFVWIFQHILEPLGNIPNFIFLLVGFAGMFYWLNVQKKYNEKAEREGGLK